MIRVEKLKKSFRGQVVLNGIDLEIPEGKTTFIIGQSGSGKSVFLRHLIGLVKPDSGHIYIEGQDVTQLSEGELKEIRKKIGMLFQDAALFDSMNVFENVSFPLVEHTNLMEDVIGDIVTEKLRLVGLRGVEKKMPSELSGGMRKRVGLARAIVLEPEVVLYDEPTTGLDPIMSDAINDLIFQTQQQLNVTSVVISHDIKGTFKVANKIAMIYKGKIIAEGAPAEFRECSEPIVQRFIRGQAEADDIIY